MSKRILTTEEITAVGQIIKDKEALQLLKEIRDNVITEEDTKGKRKSNEVFNFIGFSSGDDLLGEDNESEEYQNKKAKISKLVDVGLVLEGFHIPLERKSEKKFGDVRVANVDDKIYKYQLTDEGYAILAIADLGEAGEGAKKSGDNLSKSVSASSSESKSNNNNNGQQQQQKSKEIAAFKAEQNKELKS